MLSCQNSLSCCDTGVSRCVSITLKLHKLKLQIENMGNGKPSTLKKNACMLCKTEIEAVFCSLTGHLMYSHMTKCSMPTKETKGDRDIYIFLIL